MPLLGLLGRKWGWSILIKCLSKMIYLILLHGLGPKYGWWSDWTQLFNFTEEIWKYLRIFDLFVWKKGWKAPKFWTLPNIVIRTSLVDKFEKASIIRKKAECKMHQRILLSCQRTILDANVPQAMFLISFEQLVYFLDQWSFSPKKWPMSVPVRPSLIYIRIGSKHLTGFLCMHLDINKGWKVTKPNSGSFNNYKNVKNEFFRTLWKI